MILRIFGANRLQGRLLQGGSYLDVIESDLIRGQARSHISPFPHWLFPTRALSCRGIGLVIFFGLAF